MTYPPGFPVPPQLLVRLEQVHHIHVCPICKQEFECGCRKEDASVICDSCDEDVRR